MTDLSATRQCVKCGLCLPHCPTFRLTGNEAESPRGRISLMQLLDEPGASPTPALIEHLDHCLQCHACEAMCPSRVPFSTLMDTARARLEQDRQMDAGKRLARKLGLALMASPRARQVARALLAGYRTLDIGTLLDALPVMPASLKRLQHRLPQKDIRRTERTETVSTPRGRVDLFVGCTGDLLDRATRESVQKLLERLGYTVTVNRSQNCCGALHQHAGDTVGARHLAARNSAAFGGEPDPIITFASGCGAHLSAGQDAELAARFIDILHFLTTTLKTPPRLQPFLEKVAVHIPCTHRNALKQDTDIERVLAWIPSLQYEVLNPDGGCCGGAGSYMLSQPEFSDQLGDALAGRFMQSGARILLTTNIGCALQLQASVHERGGRIEVMHPATLIERLLV